MIGICPGRSCRGKRSSEGEFVPILPGSLSFDSAQQSMDLLAARLDALVQAWESSTSPPALATFLPPAGEIRRLTLVELIKIDLEYRWLSRNCPKRIFEYLAEFPELARDRFPSDLVYEEFHIRKQSGQDVTADEYVEAFPAQAAEIAAILGLSRPYESSSMLRGKKLKPIEGIAPGQTLDDFDLVSELGTGAFAKVFLARQKSMQRMVALKVSADQSNEPQTLAQLDHEHIVRVFDQRSLPERKLRLLYMQYVAGGTLQQVIHRVRDTPVDERSGALLLKMVDEAVEKRGEFLPTLTPTRRWIGTATWPETVCWLGARLARALDYAHKRGVLHRDIKPANVLLTVEPSPKLADFNISFSAKVAGATPAAYFGGSLAYMSPEQLEACNPAHPRRAEELDGKSDIYSLGVLLWELLTGNRPIRDEDLSGGWSATLEQMAAHRRAGVDVSELENVPDCPAGLVHVLEVALDPDAHRRWSRGMQMARHLELCTSPKECDLLFPPRKSSRIRLRSWTVFVILLAVCAPNLCAGAFNLFSNASDGSGRMSRNSASAFQGTNAAVNGFPALAGLAVAAFIGLSVDRGLRRRQRRESTAEHDGALRRRTLGLGQTAAGTNAALWTVAAGAYPVACRLLQIEMPAADVLRFWGTSFLCGLIAAAYPFFVITFFSLESLYPVFLLSDLEQASQDAPQLRRTGKWSAAYLVLAGLIPLASICALIIDKLLAPKLILDRADLAFGILTAAGLAALLPIFWLHQSIKSDLETLIGITSAGDRSARRRRTPRRT